MPEPQDSALPPFVLTAEERRRLRSGVQADQLECFLSQLEIDVRPMFLDKVLIPVLPPQPAPTAEQRKGPLRALSFYLWPMPQDIGFDDSEWQAAWEAIWRSTA
jgi:hypothetical protein